MTYETEFPHLARVTNMNAGLIKQVGLNLTAFDVDVRIDYERWVCFEKEYGEWADRHSNSSTSSNTTKERI